MARIKLELHPASEATARISLDQGTAHVTVGSIRLRVTDDSRSLSALHVVDLAESIAVLGLLEPIVVDTAGHLLAGGHRLAALQLLAEPTPDSRYAALLDRSGWKATAEQNKPNPELASLADRLADLGESPLKERYPKNKIPVQVVDVTTKESAHLALAVEAAENNIRRQYTHEEIRILAQRFKEAGYQERPGRPAGGAKTILNALQAAVGRSKRQIQNILNGSGSWDKSAWDKATDSLQRAARKVVKDGDGQTTDQAKAVLVAANMALEALRKYRVYLNRERLHRLKTTASGRKRIKLGSRKTATRRH